ncbi:hypothetical protein BJ742DRAFT_875409 [Cladochytrium replicatum]|nr:hypothetical protein BJ742DRAFT_875409 [Cladochytrium replicatum]
MRLLIALILSSSLLTTSLALRACVTRIESLEDLSNLIHCLSLNTQPSITVDISGPNVHGIIDLGQITAQVHALHVTNTSAASIFIPTGLAEDAEVVFSGNHGCTSIEFAPGSATSIPSATNAPAVVTPKAVPLLPSPTLADSPQPLHHIPLKSIHIVDNAILESITGLSSIGKVSAQLHIASNPSLTGPMSFDSLTDAGVIHIAANNEALGPSFPVLTHASSVLVSHIASISMLSLTTVDADLAITYNTQLTHVSLPALESSGPLTILGNPELSSITMDKLAVVRGDLMIQRNPKLVRGTVRGTTLALLRRQYERNETSPPTSSPTTSPATPTSSMDSPSGIALPSLRVVEGSLVLDESLPSLPVLQTVHGALNMTAPSETECNRLHNNGIVGSQRLVCTVDPKLNSNTTHTMVDGRSNDAGMNETVLTNSTTRVNGSLNEPEAKSTDAGGGSSSGNNNGQHGDTKKSGDSALAGKLVEWFGTTTTTVAMVVLLSLL